MRARLLLYMNVGLVCVLFCAPRFPLLQAQHNTRSKRGAAVGEHVNTAAQIKQ